MNIKILHFYPNLMSLYGSYANISILSRSLEQLGNTVAVEPVLPGQTPNLSDADFLFMGAGTEHAQMAALEAIRPLKEQLKSAAANGTCMLFVGNAMELLGRSIISADGVSHEALGIASFVSTQNSRRIVEDVYGHTDLYSQAVVGFINKCSIITGVETPLLTSMDMGFGNEASRSPEGFHCGNIFASQLTGPLLVKNPGMLKAVISAIYKRKDQPLPNVIPVDHWAVDGYTITEQQLKLRCNR